MLVGEVRHLGDFGGLVPPPYRVIFVRGSLCLAALHFPTGGRPFALNIKKTYLTQDSLLWSRRKVLRRSSAFFH